MTKEESSAPYMANKQGKENPSLALDDKGALMLKTVNIVKPSNNYPSLSFNWQEIPKPNSK